MISTSWMVIRSLTTCSIRKVQSELILEELPDGLQAPVAQVIDVIDVADPWMRLLIVHHRITSSAVMVLPSRTAVAQDLHRASRPFP